MVHIPLDLLLHATLDVNAQYHIYGFNPALRLALDLGSQPEKHQFSFMIISFSSESFSTANSPPLALGHSCFWGFVLYHLNENNLCSHNLWGQFGKREVTNGERVQGRYRSNMVKVDCTHLWKCSETRYFLHLIYGMYVWEGEHPFLC